MKYTCEIIIDLPRNRVVELMNDPQNLKKWQPTLKHYEPISGEMGQPGAKMRLVYDMNGGEMEMVETVTARNLPDSLAMTFDANNVHNTVVNRFIDIGPNQTRWEMDSEFTFSGFMVIMALFMRGAFPKQTRQNMQLFKDFAEAA